MAKKVMAQKGSNGVAAYLALHDQPTVAMVLIGAVTGLAAIFYLKKQPTDK